MTRANKTYVLLLFLFLWGFSKDYQSTNVFLSSDIQYIAGSGDTVILVSPDGVNITQNFGDENIVWNGFKNLIGFSAVYTDKILLITAPDFYENNYAVNNDRLWFYSFKTHKSYETKLDYDVSEKFLFRPIAASVFDDAFWIAACDGGVIKCDPESGTIEAIFFPGIDTTSFTFATITESFFKEDESPKKQLMSLAVLSDRILFAAPKAIWEFFPNDTIWNKLCDTTIITLFDTIVVDSFSSVTSAVFNDSSQIIIQYKTPEDSTDKVLQYRFYDSTWNQIRAKNTPQIISIKASNDGSIYILGDKNNISKIFIHSTNTLYNSEILSTSHFSNRLNQASGSSINKTLYDLHYFVDNNNTTFIVTSDNGIFYSLDAHNDEENDVAFEHLWRNPPIATNLDDVYAYPGIINDVGNNNKTTFAYNLSENDKVTINIFDFNMDHVISVVVGEFRNAGKNNSSGRSTDPDKDTWDGTFENNGVQSVSPGVYYFRISSEKGYRSFGKIIVVCN